MKKIKEFLFGKEDWIEVWRHIGCWSCSGVDKDWLTEASYIIQYSKSRNKHRLITKGHDPKSHSAYKIAVEKLKTFCIKK